MKLVNRLEQLKILNLEHIEIALNKKLELCLPPSLKQIIIITTMYNKKYSEIVNEYQANSRITNEKEFIETVITLNFINDNKSEQFIVIQDFWFIGAINILLPEQQIITISDQALKNCSCSLLLHEIGHSIDYFNCFINYLPKENTIISN